MTIGNTDIRLAAGQPRYLRAYRRIEEAILRGTLRAGDRIPSERALCDQLGVSRVTVRRALTELGTAGLIVGEARRGWFVAGDQLLERANELQGFAEFADERGLPSSRRVLRAETRPASFPEAEQFGIAPGADVFALERTCLLDGLAISFSDTLVPLARCPSLPDVDFEHASLFATLESRGVSPSYADHVLETTAADERTAALLDLAAGAPVMCVREVLFDDADDVLSLSTMWARGDRYRYHSRRVRRRA